MNVKVKVGGEKHPGAVLGTTATKEEYVKKQVEKWIRELKPLALFSLTEPHSAYSAFTFGIKQRWNFLMRTVPNVEPLLSPLEETIEKVLIPALSGGRNPTTVDRAILELPPGLGGLGIINPCKVANTEYQNSVKLSASLIEAIQTQSTHTHSQTQDNKLLERR